MPWLIISTSSWYILIRALHLHPKSQVADTEEEADEEADNPSISNIVWLLFHAMAYTMTGYLTEKHQYSISEANVCAYQWLFKYLICREAQYGWRVWKRLAAVKASAMASMCGNGWLPAIRNILSEAGNIVVSCGACVISYFEAVSNAINLFIQCRIIKLLSEMAEMAEKASIYYCRSCVRRTSWLFVRLKAEKRNILGILSWHINTAGLQWLNAYHAFGVSTFSLQWPVCVYLANAISCINPL